MGNRTLRVFPPKTGNLLQTVKVVRTLTGMGLLESKRWVELIPVEGHTILVAEGASGIGDLIGYAKANGVELRDETPPRIIMQFDERGYHRLVIGDKIGDWAMYEHFSELDGYMGFTEYWGDKERVVRVTDVPDVPVVSVCHECGKPSGWDGNSYAPDVCQHLIAAWDAQASMNLFTENKTKPPTPCPIRSE